MDGNNQANIGDLQAEIGQLRDDLAKLADTLKIIVSNEAREGYARARGAAEDAQARAAKTADAVGHEIADRPFTSVATAFGAGILLGMLFSRRS
jgi:ElaB/YqjD/DUF883 family membrane-anchored ribosome-binding protein